MNDPNAFTSGEVMGDVVKNRPRTYARHAALDAGGKVVPISPETIPLDVWRRVIDPTTQRPTGSIKRERMRALWEAAGELLEKLDVVVCDRCGRERPRTPRDCLTPHEGCGGQYRWFIDEYFNGPASEEDKRELVPHDWRWIACYPVTGVNEGHYVHVEFVVPQGGAVKLVRLALGKTFRGMGHAAEIARRCAVLLGA